jgi:glucose-1-phosphate adenylyltransferase
MNIQEIITHQTLGIIMGGGAGSRLFPLTKTRSKPAVPLGGKYRLVDIPLSNCINSGLNHVYVLTQFNSHSLNRHISRAYTFDSFTSGFVDILAASQTPLGETWYQGTADAVRQNLRHFDPPTFRYYIILSGDQLYRMDYRKILAEHIEKKADITIATLPVGRDDARSFGVLQTDKDGMVTRFEEKPKSDALLDSLAMPAELVAKLEKETVGERFQASMGIYVFSRRALFAALENDLVDFGKHIIPAAIEKERVQAYPFEGYWEDIGTIRSFYEANLDLCSIQPKFNFFDPTGRVYTSARFLPASKVNEATVLRAILSDGCIISHATIENSIIGIRTVIEPGTVVRDSVVMGADFYEADIGSHDPDTLPRDGRTPLGIGRNCRIERAIIDKNVCIGDGVVITPDGKDDGYDDPEGLFHVRDGVVVVPKDVTLPTGTWI